MSKTCENCGSPHIIHTEYMDICDDCLSTVVFNKGSQLSKHFTNDDFRTFYSSHKSVLDLDHTGLMDVCQRLIAMNSEIPSLLNLCGMCYMRQNEDYENAIIMFKKAIEINPRYGTAHYNLANAYRLSDTLSTATSINAKDAINHLNEAYKYITPQDSRYKEFIRGSVLSLAEMGRKQMAMATLEDAMSHGFQSTPELRAALGGKRTESAPPSPPPRTENTPSQTSNNQMNTASSSANNMHNGARQGVLEEKDETYKRRIIIPRNVGIICTLIFFTLGNVSGGVALLALIGAIAGFVIMANGLSANKNRCPQCRAWDTMETISSNVINKDRVQVKRTLNTTHRYASGKTGTTSREVLVDADEFTLKETYRCKNCGFTKEGTRKVIQDKIR